MASWLVRETLLASSTALLKKSVWPITIVADRPKLLLLATSVPGYISTRRLPASVSHNLGGPACRRRCRTESTPLLDDRKIPFGGKPGRIISRIPAQVRLADDQVGKLLILRCGERLAKAQHTVVAGIRHKEIPSGYRQSHGRA